MSVLIGQLHPLSGVGVAIGFDVADILAELLVLLLLHLLLVLDACVADAGHVLLRLALDLLPVARALWEPRPAFAAATEAWLIAGGPHHTVLTAALEIEPLIDLAEIAGIELVVIDEGMTIPAFKNELRWNQAYHRLAGGF